MIPVNPPPPVDPRYIKGLYQIHRETLRPFIGYYIYCWLKDNRKFWFCPASVDTTYIEGYTWSRGQWRHIKLTISSIDNFY